MTKTQRRRDIGLAFLNSMETERIKKIVKKTQEKLKKTVSTEQGHKPKTRKEPNSDFPQQHRRKSKPNLKSPVLLEKLKSESSKSKKQEMLNNLIKMNERVRLENQRALKSSGSPGKPFSHPKKFTLALEDSKPQELSLGEFLDLSRLKERVSNNHSDSKQAKNNFNVLYSEYRNFFSELYNNTAQKPQKSGAKSMKNLIQHSLGMKKAQQLRSKSKTAKTGTSSAGKSSSKVIAKLVQGLAKKGQVANIKSSDKSATLQPARSDGFNFFSPPAPDIGERFQQTQDIRMKKKDKGNVVELSDIEQPHVFSDSSLLMSSRDSKHSE